MHMKETDYINASNLARLRIAADILRILVPQGEKEVRDFQGLAAKCYKYVQEYEAKVSK